MKSSPQSGPEIQNSRIQYLSQPAPVSMGDWWYELATVEHFWIRRRFDVMQRLADPVIRAAKDAAEIGCGNGLLQRDMEDRYGIPVAGFELNELALERNVSRTSPLYCYNIHDRKPDFHNRFDLLFMFDVLEHITDESPFLQSAKFHLQDAGMLLINVPAHQVLYSDYDRVAGHVRRYSAKQLAATCENNGFRVRALTYWGLPLLPLLIVRKAIGMSSEDGKAGFDSRGATINRLLALSAKCEYLPQRLFGTSVMAAVEKLPG